VCFSKKSAIVAMPQRTYKYGPIELGLEACPNGEKERTIKH